MKQQETEIRTDRLTLRPLTVEDMVWVRPLADNYEIAKNLCSMPHPYDQAAVDAFSIKLIEMSKSDTDFVYGIWHENGIGVIGINKRPNGWQIGYWLGQAFWGQGYATEALKATTAFAFDSQQVENVWAHVYTDNAASAQVLRKAGFRNTGETSLQPCLARGMDIEAHLLDYRRSDWLTDQGNNRQ